MAESSLLTLTARVRAYILQHTLIGAGQTIVVAVSGGTDSLCLLHVLHALAPELGCRLHVAHLDHALRPAALEDAAFVAAQAAALGWPCTVERRDVYALARERRLSVETAARAARYAFLRGVAAATGASAIATGHTQDDQAETVLLHLTRGAGLNGVAGMAPRRGNLIRPLLEVSHAQALAYCAALGLTPREDESNRSLAFRRNHLRHEALPLLEAIQPAAGANIARAARLLAADLALIERLATAALERALLPHDATPPGETLSEGARLWDEIVSPGGTRPTGASPRPEHAAPPQETVLSQEAAPSQEAMWHKEENDRRVWLSVARWAEAEPELRPHMLRLLLGRLLGSAEGFDERAYERMLRALDPDLPDTALSLPKGLRLTRRGAVAALGPPPTPLTPLGHYTLPIPGQVQTEAGVLRAGPATAPHDWTAVPAQVVYLDPAACGPALTVRAWRPGDRLCPLGLDGSRKVQDLFVDRKVPRAKRRHIPIVEGPRGIAWVAGVCVGAEYRVEHGALALRLVWEAGGS